MLQVRRILQLKSQGKSNRDIALEVHRSRNTVNEYVKLILKIIKSGARAVHYKSALDWLSASAMVNKCIKVFQGRVPLNAFAEASSFKLYMADTGLLCAGYGISPDEIYKLKGYPDDWIEKRMRSIEKKICIFTFFLQLTTILRCMFMQGTQMPLRSWQGRNGQ